MSDEYFSMRAYDDGSGRKIIRYIIIITAPERYENVLTRSDDKVLQVFGIIMIMKNVRTQPGRHRHRRSYNIIIIRYMYIHIILTQIYHVTLNA
jgi:hypothetical protein